MRILTVLAVSFLLGGCAFGRTYSYSDTAINLPRAAGGSGTIGLAVQDRRPYVLSGNKSERFVGLMRGGFGNPFDVNTQSGGPVSIEVRDALAKALTAKGYAVNPVAIDAREANTDVRRRLTSSGGGKTVLVTLNEWKSDTMMNTDIHYDVHLTVLGPRGEELATNSVRGLDNIGSAGLSPGPTISAALGRKLELLFDNEKVIAALK
jgi:hypothetical protein